MASALSYSSLPERPQRQGPEVHTPVARLLGLLLRLVSAVYATLALALLGYALYLDWQYTHSGGGGGGGGGSGASPAPPESPPTDESPSPDPEPFASPGGPEPAWAGDIGGGSGGGGLDRAQRLLPLVVEVALPGLAKKAAKAASLPWSIYAMGAVGAYVLVMALVGASGVKRSSRWRLAVYIALLSVLILLQAAALLLLFTNNEWRQHIPADPSGCWEAAQDFIEHNGQLVKILCLAVMASELLALGAASWLHSLQQAAYEQWLDDREEAEARAREVLEQAAERQYAGGLGSLWTQRMRQKYGVTNSQVERNSEAVRQVAALSGDVPA